MKRLLLIIPVFFAAAAYAEPLHMTCVDYDVVASIGDDRAELVINGESVVLQKTADGNFKSKSVGFEKDGGEYWLTHFSGGDEPPHASPCVDKFISADCGDVVETVSLECRMGADRNYDVVAKVCDDRAVLTINGEQFVLPRNNSFFEKSDASYLSGDYKTGFVINHNEPEQYSAYGKYMLKVNGNEYPACEQI